MDARCTARRIDTDALEPLPVQGLESLLPPMAAKGLGAFVENETSCRMELIELKGGIFPLVINSGNSHRCYVSSPTCHYLKYAAQEVLRKDTRHAKRLLTLAAKPLLEMLCRAWLFDRVVSLNNWMLPTNPYRNPGCAQIEALTLRLLKTYPDHALVFRNVEPGRGPLFQNLLACGYSPQRSRLVYVWRPKMFAKLPKKTRYNIRRDLRLLDNGPYQTLDGDRTWSSADVRQFQRLYHQLYIRKHSRYNLQFSRRWFATMLNNRLSEVRAWSRNGRIEAFVMFIDERDRLTGAIIGYDTQINPAAGLYRRTVACLIHEALARNKPLFLSSGAGRFKKLRGALPITEYEMVYSHHLDWPRRAMWRFFQAFYDHTAKSNLATGLI